MGLIAHYRLDGDATDALGRFDGTENGGVTWVDGKLGQQADMSAGGRIDGLAKVGSTYSLAFWLTLKSGFTGSYRKFLQQVDATTDRSPGYWLHSVSNALHLMTRLSSTLSAGANTIEQLEVGLPYHVVHSVEQRADGVAIQVHINGNLDHSLFYSGQTVESHGESISLLSQDVEIDDVRIYDHALSKREVRDLAKGLVFHLAATPTAPKDKSLQNNTLVNNGATYTEDVPVGKGGYEFDGNDFINISSIQSDFKQKISVCAWVKYNSYTGSNGAQPYSVITCKGAPFTWLLENPSNRFRWRASIGGTDRHLNATTTHQLNQYYFVVGTYDGTEMRLYIDGVLNNTMAATGDLAVNSAVGKIGSYTNTTYNIDGTIADVRIYTEALSADEVKELYQRRASLDAQGNFYAGLINERYNWIEEIFAQNLVRNGDQEYGSADNFAILQYNAVDNCLEYTREAANKSAAWDNTRCTRLRTHRWISNLHSRTASSATSAVRPVRRSSWAEWTS